MEEVRQARTRHSDRSAADRSRLPSSIVVDEPSERKRDKGKGKERDGSKPAQHSEEHSGHRRRRRRRKMPEDTASDVDPGLYVYRPAPIVVRIETRDGKHRRDVDQRLREPRANSPLQKSSTRPGRRASGEGKQSILESSERSVPVDARHETRAASSTSQNRNKSIILDSPSSVPIKSRHRATGSSTSGPQRTSAATEQTTLVGPGRDPGSSFRVNTRRSERATEPSRSNKSSRSSTGGPHRKHNSLRRSVSTPCTR
jgi:hypothetical protein